MGVQLGDLVEAKKVSIDDLSGRAVAFDGHNILYQFLAIIRGQGGEPLKDSKGRITSHLSGLIYRMKYQKVVILLFRSGKIVLTGANREEQVHEAVEKMRGILVENGLLY